MTDFPDYRSYLAALYLRAKDAAHSYSYALFSADLGLSSTNAHSIIQGRRHLSEKTAGRLSEKLALTKAQERALIAMVKQAHAKTNLAREEAFQERVEVQRRQLPRELSRRQLEFFQHWYHSVILEFLRLPSTTDDPQVIAQKLLPHLPLAKVKQSLKLLKSLGYIAYSKQHKRLIPTETLISTGNEVQRLAVLSYHREMMGLAMQAMDDLPAEARNISAITVAVSDKLAQQMHDELIALRKRFLQLATEETAAQKILQMNIQLFELTGEGRKT